MYNTAENEMQKKKNAKDKINILDIYNIGSCAFRQSCLLILFTGHFYKKKNICAYDGIRIVYT